MKNNFNISLAGNGNEEGSRKVCIARPVNQSKEDFQDDPSDNWPTSKTKNTLQTTCKLQVFCNLAFRAIIDNRELIPMRPSLIRQFSLLALNSFVSCTTICVVVLDKTPKKLTLDSLITNLVCTKNQEKCKKFEKFLFDWWVLTQGIIYFVQIKWHFSTSRSSKLHEIIIFVADS